MQPQFPILCVAVYAGNEAAERLAENRGVAANLLFLEGFGRRHASKAYVEEFWVVETDH